MTEQQDRIEMPDLVTDYHGAEDPELPGNHFWFTFPNGYSASVLRVHDTRDGHKTLGYDEGKWEAIVLYRDEFTNIIGLTYGMPVFDTGLTPDAEGAVAGHLDNAGVNEFLTKIAALPARPRNAETVARTIPITEKESTTDE